MPSEQDVAFVVDGRDCDPGFAQQTVGITTRGAEERIESDLEPSFLDRGEIDDLAQSGQISRLHLDLFRRDRRGAWLIRRNPYVGRDDLRLDLLRDLWQCRRA